MTRTTGWASPILGQPSDGDFECSSDVKWRIHLCHLSKKSKPSGLNELRKQIATLRRVLRHCSHELASNCCKGPPGCEFRGGLGAELPDPNITHIGELTYSPLPRTIRLNTPLRSEQWTLEVVTACLYVIFRSHYSPMLTSSTSHVGKGPTLNGNILIG